MKREYLKGLGLEDDVIDQIMGEYGRSVQPLQDQITSKDQTIITYKTDLKTAKDTIETFKKENKDVDAIQQQADDWKKKYEKAEEDRRTFKVKTKKESVLKDKLFAEGVKDVNTAVKLINFDSITVADDGSVIGVDDVVKDLKGNESLSSLFGANKFRGQDPSEAQEQEEKEGTEKNWGEIVAEISKPSNSASIDQFKV